MAFAESSHSGEQYIILKNKKLLRQKEERRGKRKPIVSKSAISRTRKKKQKALRIYNVSTFRNPS